MCEELDFKPVLKRLEIDDFEEAVALYNSVKGMEGCPWDEDYPNPEITKEDIEAGDLYGFKNNENRLVTVIARDRDAQVDALECWDPELAPAGELCRLAVAVDYMNHSLARQAILQIMDKLRERGFKSAHYLVAVKNERARKSYAKLGFEKKGEVFMFENDYYCYEICL